ncbi:MAG TPA: DNA polymerase/3'-5' exonuclease PolX [Pseudonocardiaceae bacterium]|nr:DNA polymerase/3'-5' exonuclease PolX [Pseudonocardiaceae bacterium]
MSRRNEEVGALFDEYADLLAITGGDPFKIRAYQKAGRAVGSYHEDVGLLDVKQLCRIPNVGRAIAEKIVEYVRTGRVRAVEDARAKIPPGLRELTTIPTLGPRKAMQLHELLGISSVPELIDAIDAGLLRELRGFGARTEERIRRGIELMPNAGGRVHVNVAAELAGRIVAELSTVDGCVRCAPAGSLRRLRETVGDVDILAAAEDSGPLMAAFAGMSIVDSVANEVVAGGARKTSIRTAGGLQVDLRVVPPGSWGAALQYFTGSREHNVRVRELAVRAGLKLNEYGLFDAGTGEVLAAETEEQVYARLGMAWVPPALREDRGEVEAALRGELPALVTEDDIRGDLHTHTDLTDGVSSLTEMLAGAAARGYSYYAVTDHAPNLFMQRMTDEKMLRQRAELRALDGRYGPMRLLHGTELNIDPDGEVDWPVEILRRFDVCVASVHSHFRQPRAEMTRRIVRACENPGVNIIGHLTTRQIGRRGPIDVDLDEVFRAAARTGTALEINSHPDRLDLCDEHILRARRFGARFAVNSDAHSVLHLDLLRYGIGNAQRGWLTADDVINTWPLERLRAFLAKPGP